MPGLRRLQRWHRRHYEQGYIRAVHYFGDGWPVNCWSTMNRAGAREDFRQIREDGFNAVILVVPWRGFQIRQFPPSYEPAYLRLLAGLMREAARARLWVILRVSYSHHICDQAPLISRHLTASFLTDPGFHEPWLHYLRLLRRRTRWHANFYGSFICWEEFWHGLMRFADNPEEDRGVLARTSGYADFVGNAEAEIPDSRAPEFADYQAFINHRLKQLFLMAREVLPTLGFEFRVDRDPLYRADGSLDWLDNDYLLDQPGTRYSYWAPFIGAANEGEELTAQQALALLDYNLAEQTDRGSRRQLIIDQFNFVDDTFKYAGHNARLAESQVAPFLAACAEHLPRYSIGYGIWAWRDYHQNHLFNPGFRMGLKGWRVHAGKIRCAARSGAITLTAGDEIGQDFASASHGMHHRYRTTHCELELRVEDAADSMVEASLDGEHYHSLLPGSDDATGLYCRLPIDNPVYEERGARFRLRIVRGNIRVRQLALYQYSYRVGIRNVAGAAGPYLAPLRELNRALATREHPR